MSDRSADKMVSFVEALVPGTQCNLKCHYCYLIQEGRRKMQKGAFMFDVETMAKAFNPDRWGGKIYISLCGEGETLLWKDLPEFVNRLLQQGHYVNITTNGTITNAFTRFISLIPKELLSHLNFSFSYHPIELSRLHLEDCFFANVKRVRIAGCSFIVQINLCDEYIPLIDDVINKCVSEVGAPPQLAATRRLVNGTWELYTNHTPETYKVIGSNFASPLFNFTMKNFMVKREEYCYAGRLSFTLKLATGQLSPCYNYKGARYDQYIFGNLTSPIRHYCVGRKCACPYCINSSHFIALGVMPDYDAPTYGQLRNRICSDGSEWYTPEYKKFVNQKLYQNLRGRNIERVADWANKRFYRIKEYYHNISSKLLPAKS